MTSPFKDFIASALEADMMDKTPFSDTRRQAIEMDLKDMCQRYQTACPYLPGDMVTPRANSGANGHGDPHIVIEVFDTPVRADQIGKDVSDVSSSAFLSRLDCRVACMAEDGMRCFAMESWMLEPYPQGDAS